VFLLKSCICWSFLACLSWSMITPWCNLRRSLSCLLWTKAIMPTETAIETTTDSLLRIDIDLLNWRTIKYCFLYVILNQLFHGKTFPSYATVSTNSSLHIIFYSKCRKLYDSVNYFVGINCNSHQKSKDPRTLYTVLFCM